MSFGYLLVAASIALGVVITATAVAIQNARHRAWYAQHPLSPEAQKAFMEASKAYMDESLALAKKYL